MSESLGGNLPAHVWARIHAAAANDPGPVEGEADGDPCPVCGETAKWEKREKGFLLVQRCDRAKHTAASSGQTPDLSPPTRPRRDLDD